MGIHNSVWYGRKYERFIGVIAGSSILCGPYQRVEQGDYAGDEDGARGNEQLLKPARRRGR